MGARTIAGGRCLGLSGALGSGVRPGWAARLGLKKRGACLGFSQPSPASRQQPFLTPMAIARTPPLLSQTRASAHRGHPRGRGAHSEITRQWRSLERHRPRHSRQVQQPRADTATACLLSLRCLATLLPRPPRALVITPTALCRRHAYRLSCLYVGGTDVRWATFHGENLREPTALTLAMP